MKITKEGAITHISPHMSCSVISLNILSLTSIFNIKRMSTPCDRIASARTRTLIRYRDIKDLFPFGVVFLLWSLDFRIGRSAAGFEIRSARNQQMSVRCKLKFDLAAAEPLFQFQLFLSIWIVIYFRVDFFNRFLFEKSSDNSVDILSMVFNVFFGNFWILNLKRKEFLIEGIFQGNLLKIFWRNLKTLNETPKPTRICF